MVMDTRILDFITRLGTELKDIRSDFAAVTGALGSLTTTDKANLVAAINEVQSEVGGGGATTLDQLTDVVIAGVASGHILRHNGTNFVNVAGTTHYDAAGSAAAAQAASQPLDSDLTAIAALSTTPYGRDFLALANQAALMSLLTGASTTVSGIVELATNAETLTGSSGTLAVTPAGLQAKIDALVNSAPGLLDTLDELAAALGDDPNFAATITTALAGKQPLDADLTAIAALTSAADKMPYATGTGTWAMATVTTFARSLLDDADAGAARTTLDVWSKAEVGPINTDYVAAFETAIA